MDTSEPSAKQQELLSLSALDSITSAINSKIIPDQEYLLQGSILDGPPVDVLLHRLRGLCDNVDLGPESFNDHEVCFVLYGNPNAPQQGAPLTLRVRKPCDDPTAPWHLRYIGQPELGNRPTMVRSTLDVAVGSDIVEFLKELGCRREFDFVTKGYIFRKGRLKIIVGKLFRHDPTKSPQDLETISASHYVEMSCVAPAGHDTVGEDMKTLAEQLRPLINLDKVEPRRIP